MSGAPHPTFNRYLAGVLRRLHRIGIELHPFFLVREGMVEQSSESIALNPQYQFSQLDENDLPGIHNLRPGMDINRYANMIRRGTLCFGIKDEGKLIAKMWVNLEEYNSALYSQPLQADEAYLFDAFANPDYRGQNLAPYLRLKCYQAAISRGRTRIYSISDFTNTPARKFKQKLGATNQSLMLYVKLFGSNAKLITLRRYRLP